MRPNTKYLIAGTIVIFISIAVFSLLSKWYNKVDSKLETTESTPSFEKDMDYEQLSETPSQTGFIKGSLSYPSEQIPPELVTCAQLIEGNNTICTNEQISSEEFTYGIGYELKVPPGNYYVYSNIPNQDYKAYYSEFVTCGLSIECQSHKPIIVTVVEGKTVSNVDPHDWYNINPSM
jgi:hypothetical protein